MRRRWNHAVFLELRRDSRLTTGISGFLLCRPGKPKLPFEFLGKAGGCARLTEGQRDLIESCVQDLIFISREIGISGLHSRLTRGIRPRLEGKQRTPLSSRVATRISWSPLSGLKGVKPPLQFGERTRDCSPGHAGKEGPHLSMMGASQGFPLAVPPVGVFSRGTTRITGSLSCGVREVRSPCTWREGARLFGVWREALHPWQRS